MIPSASIPAVRQNRSKLTETASQALSTAPIPVGGKAVNGVIAFFMALLSFRGISTPSLPAQGEQRRSFYFNIPRGNSGANPSSSCSPARNCSVLYEESAQFPEMSRFRVPREHTSALMVMGHCSELPAAWQHSLQDAVTVDENMRKRSGDMNA